MILTDIGKQYLIYPRWFRGGEIEYCGEQALIRSQVRYTGEDIYIYGAGRWGFYTLAWLRRERCPVKGMIDTDPKKIGQLFCGTEVIGLDEYAKRNNSAILLAVYLGNKYDEVTELLTQYSNTKRVIKVDVDKLYDSPASAWAYEYYIHRKKFKEVFDALLDQKSKETLCELMRASLYNDFIRELNLPSHEKYWGDGVYEVKPDEDIAVVGGGTGDTVYYYLDHFHSFKRCVVFEPEGYELIKANLSFLPENIIERVTIEKCYVSDDETDNVVTLNGYYDKTKPSIVTMDIEGMEKNALVGASELIKKGETVFAISAYHKWDDLIEFMGLFKSLNNDYIFALRKYAALYRINNNETVLYAIPKQRIRSKG